MQKRKNRKSEPKTIITAKELFNVNEPDRVRVEGMNYDAVPIKSNYYGQILQDAGVKDARAKRLLKRFPIEETYFAADKCGRNNLTYGKTFGSLVVRFYYEIANIMNLWGSIQDEEIGDEIRRDPSKTVTYARKFVKENGWLVKGLKKIFRDADDLMIEQIAGDYLVLDSMKFDAADKIAWFLCHYKTEEVKV